MSKDIKLMIYQVKDRLRPLIILRSLGSFYFLFNSTFVFYGTFPALLCMYNKLLAGANDENILTAFYRSTRHYNHHDVDVF